MIVRHHRHDWNLIDKTMLPPIGQLTKVRSQYTEDTRLLLDAMRQKVVLTFKCDCGRIRIEKR